MPPDQPSPLTPEPGPGQPGTLPSFPQQNGGGMSGSLTSSPDSTAGEYPGYLTPLAEEDSAAYGVSAPLSPRGCRRALPWTLGCCGLLILVMVGGAIFSVSTLSSNPLSGFPSYPSAVLASTSSQNGIETERWSTTASITIVEGYYATALTTPWTVDRGSEAGSTWQFSSSSGASGTLSFSPGNGGGTTITATASYPSRP